MSVKSKHSSTKKEKIRKKEKRKKVEESEEDIESSEEELDLTKECHTIGYYINDRAEMINQMFSVIKGNKLKAMLPPILKDCDLETLKLQCLDQLLGMSEKRIQCILEGEILESSSESEVPDSDDEESDQKNGTSSGSSSDKSESHDGEKSVGSESRRKKRKSDSMSDGKSSKVPKTEAENPAPEKGKTLLEILELEMRARAIRALLKKGGEENATENANGSKTPDANHTGEKHLTGEVVDLTECEDDEPPIPSKKEKPDEAEIDKKVSSFEEKIVKSQEKTNQNQDEKAKRLQAELELRNKLFKKKIYRTRQQRMENDDEDKSINQNENQEKIDLANVVVKEEPKEPEDIVIEDPEEGEVSTSEDEYPVEIKQEPEEPEPEPVPEPEPEESSFNAIDREGERIAAMDNGAFVMNENVDYPIELAMQNEGKEVTVEEFKETVQTDIDESTQEPSESSNLDKPENDKVESEQNDDDSIGETSWRERWLRKDGVQKLVKSSKIYAKVKKRIAEKSQKEKLKEEAASLPEEVCSDSNSNSRLEVIEGSIEEYERLTGKVLEIRKDDDVDKEVSNEERKEDVENTKVDEKSPEKAKIEGENEDVTEAQKLEDKAD